jgi:hypothetical protein
LLPEPQVKVIVSVGNSAPVKADGGSANVLKVTIFEFGEYVFVKPF